MCLITVGATLLSCISELMSAATELIKANINERIIKHNITISKLSEGSETRAVGFQIQDEEDEYDE